MDKIVTEIEPTPRRVFQFTLRGLMMFVTAWCLLLGLLVTFGSETSVAFLGFVFSMGLIACILVLTYLFEPTFLWFVNKSPVIVTPLAYFFLTLAFHLFGGIISRPFPVRQVRDVFGSRLNVSLSAALQCAVVMLVVAAIHTAYTAWNGKPSEDDRLYCPRLVGLRAALSRRGPRAVLVVGFLLLFGEYCGTVVQWYGIVHRPHGSLYWPEQAFLTCMVGWAILWIADASARPKCATLWPAIAFLASTLCLIDVGGFIVE